MKLSPHTYCHLYADVVFIQSHNEDQAPTATNTISITPFVARIHNPNMERMSEEQEEWIGRILTFFGIPSQEWSTQYTASPTIDGTELVSTGRGFFIFSDDPKWLINNRWIAFKQKIDYIQGSSLFMAKLPSISTCMESKNDPIFKQQIKTLFDQALSYGKKL